MIEMAGYNDYLHIKTPMLNGRDMEEVYIGYEKALGEKETFLLFCLCQTNNC